MCLLKTSDLVNAVCMIADLEVESTLMSWELLLVTLL